MHTQCSPPVCRLDENIEKLLMALPHRSRSIFEGASKYEILHYLRDAKDRIGASSSCSGEIDPSSNMTHEGEDSEPVSRVQTPSGAGEAAAAVVTLRRNQGHRVSAISTASDSSACSSVDSSDNGVSGGVGSVGGVLLHGPAERLAGMVNNHQLLIDLGWLGLERSDWFMFKGSNRSR